MSALDRVPDDDLDSVSSGGSNGSYDDDRGSSSGGSSSKEQEEEDKIELANRESTIVFRLRLLVFIVLLLAAVAVSLIVYYITSGAEEEESKSQYEAASEKVIEAFKEIVDHKLGAVSSLGVAAIAHGVDHTRNWPFVSLSSFQQRAATARAESGALYVHISPMVSESDREEWDEFVTGEDSNWM
jgi:Na+-transporting methylmalonyl-CoA/oxaloacetate decarboxylase gamma subunit